MVKVLDKWNRELTVMTGRGRNAKEQSQIKRCMLHIFEVYEEAFPHQKVNKQ